MTAKDFSKAYTQLKNKPAKWKKVLKHNAPRKRSCGKANKKCILTNTTRGVIGQWGMKIGRRTFRLNAIKLGFRKYN